jgi:hypothetical protein
MVGSSNSSKGKREEEKMNACSWELKVEMAGE